MSVKDSPEMKETDARTTVKQHDGSETDLWRLIRCLWDMWLGPHDEVDRRMKPCNDKENWTTVPC